MTDWMQELCLLAAAEYRARPIVATLATVDLEGCPRARTVIVRWLDEQGDSIWITADERSAKVAQLRANPWGEMVFWASHERQQFRVRGRLEIVRDGPVRQDVWNGLRDTQRAPFFWPTPGELRREGDLFPATVSTDVPPPEAFVLLALRATEAEALELNESPHRRRRWREAGGWRVELINP